MGQFRKTLSDCELKEIHLQNRKYTWSNKREKTMLVKLDRVFCNEAWDVHFKNHVLRALSTSFSDHCPLLLSNSSWPRRPRIFHFENFYIKVSGFKDIVLKAWQASNHHTEPFHRLKYKLAAMATRLRAWNKTIFSPAKLQHLMATEVILWLDIA